jgi:hypothetical protein
MDMSVVSAALAAPGVPVHDGYPATGAKLPYIVNRPMIISPELLAVSGDAVNWDFQWGVYCCGASVEASYNLARAVIQALQGTPLSGSTLSCSMGYVGAQVESHYESQVTLQINQ